MADRITQTCVEIARLRLATGQLRVTQTCLEVVMPYVPGGTGTFNVSGAAEIVFTAIAAGGRGYAKAASASIIFTARGNAFHGIYRQASATIVFMPRAVVTNRGVGAHCHATIIFRPRCRNKVPPIVFGDDYLGRFQLGSEVPLWDLVRDQHGQPALPTTDPPIAEVYNIDLRTHVESVNLVHLRYSRNDSVYTRSLRLGAIYVPGRYGVVYRAPTGGFVGYNLAIFEVVPGGDVSGPAIATHTFPAAGGDQTMAQLGSGALVKGSRPRVT